MNGLTIFDFRFLIFDCACLKQVLKMLLKFCQCRRDRNVPSIQMAADSRDIPVPNPKKSKIANQKSKILMSCVLYLAFCFLLCSASQASESLETVRYIRRIIFRGNSAVNDETLVSLLAVQPGQRFDPPLIDRALPRILTEYKKLGYMFAKAEWEHRPAEKGQVVVYVSIHEGEVISMGKIELFGNSAFSRDQLLDRLDVFSSPLFDDSVFHRDMERLLKFYSDNGHPLAKIAPSDFRVEDGKLNVSIYIDEGPLVKIEQVRIHGLKKTRESVILRELTVQAGDIFDQREIDESQRRLNNMGYFGGLSQTSFSQAEDDRVILSFSVTEERTGSFSGILGYNPSEEESGQRFTGVIEAAETNLLGTGRQLAIRSKFGITDTYEFAYEEPWIFDTPVDIGIRIWGTQQEAQSIDTGAGKQEDGGNILASPYPESFKEWAVSLSGTTRVIRSMEGSLAVTYKRIDGSADILSASSDDLLNGRKYSLTFALQRDTRDYFINPSTGRLDRASVEVSRGDFKTVKVSLDLNQYFKTWQRQVLAMGLHGARIWGERMPLTEILHLGGANTLRGYSEDFFRGEGRLFANCEYRFLVSRDSQFFLFLDGGTVYNKDDGLDSLKLGYGAGMRLKSRTGLVSMDYGLAKGDSILSGKIHVSLGATF